MSPKDCPVCAGEARLEVNAAMALQEGLEAWPDRDRVYHGTVPKEDATLLGARIVSTAVWVGLARCTRDTAERPLHERRQALGRRAADFRRWHLLRGGAPVRRVDECLPPDAGDKALVTGLCAPHERPTSRCLDLGEAPRVSAAGHPSVFARVVDPMDLDGPRGKRFMDNRRVWNAADSLDRAVTEVANTGRNDDEQYDMVGAAA